MEQMTYEQKIAVMRIVKDIVLADGIIDAREIELLQQLAYSLNLESGFEKDVDSLLSLLALSIIDQLSDCQKQIVAQKMGEMIVVDKDINYNEVRLYNIVCKCCRIEKPLEIAESDGYTYSPEDMMPEDFLC